MGNLRLTIYSDEYYMEQALIEAQKAAAAGEVPVGAIIVCNRKIISRAHNQTQLLHDVTAHAEILAITTAANHLDSKYLEGCTIYVTLEPCPMCAGALFWSQISRVVYGASDDERGFMRFGKEMLHTGTRIEYGILHQECSDIIKQFFKDRRKS